MSFLPTRGLGEEATLVTAGLGPEAGTTFMQALSGTITMFGTLVTLFIPDSGAGKRQGGIAIDIDIGID